MEQKDLTGYRFTDNSGNSYQVLAGYEGSEIVYEECDKNTPLCFCCDVKIVDSRLKCSYRVSYTVTKEEFFTEIEGFCEEKKKDATTIASALREKYYKIPTVFLKLVGEVYLEAEKTINDICGAHKYSSNHYEALRNDKKCGCFYCCKIFAPSEISSWLSEPNGGKTAICPYCGIDAVIGESSGYPITEEFLEKMRRYWFR